MRLNSLLRLALALTVSIALLSLASVLAAEPTGWDSVPAILAEIKPPTFPDRDFRGDRPRRRRRRHRPIAGRRSTRRSPRVTRPAAAASSCRRATGS